VCKSENGVANHAAALTCNSDSRVRSSVAYDAQEIAIACNEHTAILNCKSKLLLIRSMQQFNFRGSYHVNVTSP
jgi:hypothetical protein